MQATPIIDPQRLLRFAPEWVNFVTVDGDGSVQWHASAPTPWMQNSTWQSSGDKRLNTHEAIDMRASNNIDWRVCCWERGTLTKKDATIAAPEPIDALTILADAPRHIKHRAKTYDKPAGERSMGAAVAMFNACHGTKITEAQGWHLMELVKHVRFFAGTAYHADSMEDGINFAALRGEARANGRG